MAKKNKTNYQKNNEVLITVYPFKLYMSLYNYHQYVLYVLSCNNSVI